MKPAAVTFDCAETLLTAHAWHPVEAPYRSMVKAGRDIGLDFTTDAARDSYFRAVQGSAREYASVGGDDAARRSLWIRVTEEWLGRNGFEADPNDLFDRAEAHLFGPESDVFRPFDDVTPCLDGLAELGVRVAVISNWDSTLGLALGQHGLLERFEFAIASMVVGVEKPDPAIFHMALERLELPADRVWHVGDNPLDDVEGARRAGIKPILIDRLAPASSELRVRSLVEIVERCRA